MANDIRDEHKEPRPESGAGQNPAQRDSDRDYAARNQSEGEQSTSTPERGTLTGSAPQEATLNLGRGDAVRAEAKEGRANSDDRGVYGKPGAFYESQHFAAGERGGSYGGTQEPTPATGEGDSRAGWRATTETEAEQPGAGDPLGDGVR